jgi:hypothetical protein
MNLTPSPRSGRSQSTVWTDPSLCPRQLTLLGRPSEIASKARRSDLHEWKGKPLRQRHGGDVLQDHQIGADLAVERETDPQDLSLIRSTLADPQASQKGHCK